ncbi:hypothetical protein C8R45DRAFT_934171 [Mycena sanguinolenta]|nr:hypothetical protein C8R45DRAFT_934171 [Mycena sanguinolenta]
MNKLNQLLTRVATQDSSSEASGKASDLVAREKKEKERNVGNETRYGTYLEFRDEKLVAALNWVVELKGVRYPQTHKLSRAPAASESMKDEARSRDPSTRSWKQLDLSLSRIKHPYRLGSGYNNSLESVHMVLNDEGVRSGNTAGKKALSVFGHTTKARRLVPSRSGHVKGVGGSGGQNVGSGCRAQTPKQQQVFSMGSKIRSAAAKNEESKIEN